MRPIFTIFKLPYCGRNVVAGIVLVSLIFLASCDFTHELNKDNNNTPGIPVPENESKSRSETPVQTFRLWHKLHQYDLSSFEYFGAFFDKRLEFYYTRSPEIRIGPASVDLMMLYFLDDHLVRIRYHLNSDITSYLLDSLGLGELKTQYTRNKRVYATEKTLKTLRDFNLKNSRPDQFAIAWDRHIIESIYNVDPFPSSIYKFDTISANFVYVDQLKSYHSRLIEIENAMKRKHAAIQ